MNSFTHSDIASMQPLGSSVLHFPEGIIGYADVRDAEVKVLEQKKPFSIMKLEDPTGFMNLLVIEPRDFHLNYEPIFFENDLISLGITDKADVALLNVISTEANSADEISVNLIGPFLINRKLKIGKQVVIQNYANYSVKHHIPKADSETKSS